MKPILFSTPMVQALLNGTKTQTRRTAGLSEINKNPDEWECIDIHHHSNGLIYALMGSEKGVKPIMFPYGGIGTRLWVRETFRHNGVQYQYFADGKQQCGDARWKPGIHMPREASRITLEVVSIGIERVAEISQQDAIAEGIGRHEGEDGQTYYQSYTSAPETYILMPPYESFKSLWQSINGKPKPIRHHDKTGEEIVPSWVVGYETYPFDASCAVPHTHHKHVPLHQRVNPWVWVIRFKEVSNA